MRTHRKSVSDRLWAKVSKDGPVPSYAPHLGRCWIWTSCLDTKGYAQLSVNGSLRMAHRLAYEQLCGQIPQGLVLDHLCRVPHCVNPAHLEPVTFAENIRRGTAKSVEFSKRTQCPQGHPYDTVNTFVDGGKRRCRECRRAYAAKWREKNREHINAQALAWQHRKKDRLALT